MDAFISGSASIAATINGDHATIISLNGSKGQQYKYTDVLRQFCTYSDTIHLVNVNEKKVIQCLSDESKKSEALLFVLTILDSGIDSEFIPELASYADELLKNDLVLKYIRGNLFSRPLPENTIKTPPNSLKPYSTINHFIERLLFSQDKISQIYESWIDSARKFHLKNEDVSLIEGVFSSINLIYLLCQSSTENSVINNLKFESLQRLYLVPNSRQIITNLFENYTDNKPEIHRVIPKNDHKVSKGSHKSQRGFTAKQKTLFFKQAESQIKKVNELIDQNSIVPAKRIVHELISSQLERGDNNYAAMSLCNLSEKAKSITNYSLQLEWAKYAVDICPEDPRSYGHVADAYLNLNQMQSSLEWFMKSAEVAPGESYGKSGIARVLRLRFDYDGALDVINQLLSDGFEDQEIFCQKAEILRDIGQLEQAADLYDKLSKKFIHDSRSMCGLGAVRADQTKYEEAELVYRNCMRLYPDEHVAFSSLGFLLARQGRFSEGLELIDKGIELANKNEEPDFISYCSKAKALVMNGEYGKAEKLYQWIIEKAYYVIDARLAFLQMLIDTNRIDEAKSLLEQAKSDFPNDEQLLLSEGTLLSSQGKFEDALQIFDTIKRSHPRWTEALLGRAKLLKRMKAYGLARAEYENVLLISNGDRRAKIGIAILDTIDNKASIRPAVYLETQSPVTIDDWDELQIKGLILLAQGDANAANDLFTEGFEIIPFGSIKPKFADGLIISQIKSGNSNYLIEVFKSTSDKNRTFFSSILGTGKELIEKVEKSLEQDVIKLNNIGDSSNILQFHEKVIEIGNTSNLSKELDLKVIEMLMAA